MTHAAAARPAADRLGRLRGQAWTGWVSTLVRLALGGIWIAAGLAKIGEPDGAVVAVRAYQLLPEWAVHPFAYGQPFIEVAVGVLLIIGLGTRVAAVVSAVLLLMFIGAIISVWVRGISIDCGCFGGGGEVAKGDTKYLQEILRDSGFLLMSVWLMVFPHSRLSLDELLFGRPERWSGTGGLDADTVDEDDDLTDDLTDGPDAAAPERADQAGSVEVAADGPPVAPVRAGGPAAPPRSPPTREPATLRPATPGTPARPHDHRTD